MRDMIDEIPWSVFPNEDGAIFSNIQRNLDMYMSKCSMDVAGIFNYIPVIPEYSRLTTNDHRDSREF